MHLHGPGDTLARLDTTASQGTTVTVESREKSPTHHLAACFGMPPFTQMPVVLSALSGNDKRRA